MPRFRYLGNQVANNVAGLTWQPGQSQYVTDERAAELRGLPDIWEESNGAVGGALNSGEWMPVPSIFRIRLTGTGTCVLDSRSATGAVTVGVASYTASDAADQIEFPYAGDNAVAIRATLTGTCKAEVI